MLQDVDANITNWRLSLTSIRDDSPFEARASRASTSSLTVCVLCLFFVVVSLACEPGLQSDVVQHDSHARLDQPKRSPLLLSLSTILCFPFPCCAHHPASFPPSSSPFLASRTLTHAHVFTNKQVPFTSPRRSPAAATASATSRA